MRLTVRWDNLAEALGQLSLFHGPLSIKIFLMTLLLRILQLALLIEQVPDILFELADHLFILGHALLFLFALKVIASSLHSSHLLNFPSLLLKLVLALGLFFGRLVVAIWIMFLTLCGKLETIRLHVFEESLSFSRHFVLLLITLIESVELIFTLGVMLNWLEIEMVIVWSFQLHFAFVLFFRSKVALIVLLVSL